MWLPTVSTTPAQRSFCNGLPASLNSARSNTVTAPSCCRNCSSDDFPVAAATLKPAAVNSAIATVPDTAGRAGHQDLALIGRHPVLQQGVHAKAGGVAGGADRHRLAGRESGGQGYQPVAVEAGTLSEAAPMRLADAPTVEHHAVALAPVGVATLGDHAGEIDTRDHRKFPHDGRFARNGQAVLVIQRGVLDVDADRVIRAVGQLRLVQVGDPNRLSRLAFFDQNC